MKVLRHRAILDIVAKERIVSQKHLCDVLTDRGFKVTQATVSRDTKILNLIKIADSQGYRLVPPEIQPPRQPSDRIKRVFLDSVTKIVDSDNLLIIRTIPGSAHMVASNIDGSGIEEIVGTVAGDDTIIVVIKPREAVAEILRRFQEILEQ